jgi:hypothetical protein
VLEVMRRLALLVVFLLVPVPAHADVPRFGYGPRITAQTGTDLMNLPGGHLRLHVGRRMSVELAVDLVRHEDALYTPYSLPVPVPEDLRLERQRRHAVQLDLAARYHLVSTGSRDLYVLAGPGASREVINYEDACGDVTFNGGSTLRPRIVAGIGAETRTTLGRSSLIALGVELRGFALLGDGAVAGNELTTPPEMDRVGVQAAGTLTIYMR